MTPGQLLPADVFRAAVTSKDVAAIEAALADYLAWFRSQRRDLAEIAAARDLLECALRSAADRRTEIATELAHITALSSAYRPRRLAHTWRLDA